MMRGPTTVPKPTLVKTRPLGILAVPLNLLADPRQMALWKVAVGNKEAGQALWQGAGGFRGTKRAEWAGHTIPWLAVVMGGGTGCGARAIMGTWALLSGGHQSEGSLDVFGAEGGRKWMLLVSQEERGLGGHGIHMSPNPTPVSVPPLSFGVVET